MKLSILICTLESRRSTFEALEAHLLGQCRNRPVEVLHERDSGQISTGAKRNKLLERAAGDYVVFVDDDDWVTDDYTSSILRAIDGSDAISIDGWMTTDGADERSWRISIHYPWAAVNENGREVYLRYPNHITPVRREHALAAGFPDKSNFEDKAYADALRPLLKSEVRVGKKLYHYRYSTKNKSYV